MTWHIHIQGQVQGVGFRPFVFLLAKKYNLNGSVNNTSDGVHIIINAEKAIADKFLNEVFTNAPKHSKVTHITLSEVDDLGFDDFQIRHSSEDIETNLLITPDIAICEDCRSEILDSSNSRFGYSFTTCTNCGPRYSIIDDLPYDRYKTGMSVFHMCEACHSEYSDPHNRRYYSQTNSCPECGINLTLHDLNGGTSIKDQGRIIDQVVKIWSNGGIVAIKGIGGYLLTCDANDATAIQNLRNRKHRPSKPLAVMMSKEILNVSGLELNEDQKSEFENHIAPIVIIDIKKGGEYSLDTDSLAPNLSQIGVLRDYTPLYALLLNKYQRPIVATSANISNAPIIFEDSKAKDQLSNIADYILSNNRSINIPQDDSLVKYSPFTNQRIVLRRSRGMAPTYINGKLKVSTQCILATGALMKSTFCYLSNGNFYLSQYLGNLENYESLIAYKKTIGHLLKLLDKTPEVVLIDEHPDYVSSIYGKEIAKVHDLRTHAVQHHVAHFSAVLGEHNKVETDQPVLGVIWDGTGLGSDGQIWGGEFFKYENYEFNRCFHFDYFDHISGNKMALEPRLSALSVCHDVMGAAEYIQDKFTDIEHKIYARILENGSSIKTSSVGRIFDAVASLLDITDIQSYEGEASMRLESLALEYFKKNGLDFSESYFTEGAHYYRVPTKTLITNIIIDIRKKKPRDFIAAKFHFSLMKIIRIVARNLQVKQIAFSGGVFQNTLLVDLIKHHLQNEFELLFHIEMSPNDENISFGQIINYHIELKKNTLHHHKKIEQCV